MTRALAATKVLAGSAVVVLALGAWLAGRAWQKTAPGLVPTLWGDLTVPGVDG